MRVLRLFLLIPLLLGLAACSANASRPSQSENSLVPTDSGDSAAAEPITVPASEVTQLEDGLSTIRFEGDSGFDEFLSQGGAASDGEVAGYLTSLVKENISLGDLLFGCSTISVQNTEGGYLFGRNFDWEPCNAMIVHSAPEIGYKSISTVNTDFITMSGVDLSQLPYKYQALICLYAPLDGMNEKGLAVSVNMIQDSDTIGQNTGKPGLTTTTAIRLLLDKAATVDETIDLLGQYDMHASMGYMMHLAIADNTGRSVVVEYINNEMVVVETPVVTNFYLAEGEKNGIGTSQSRERYDILMETLAAYDTMTTDGVRDALNSVSKDNFGEFESTEWSVVFDLGNLTARYYHRENYAENYTFQLD
ncbi:MULTISPECIES: carcinine hydrolase/isopenicillin-N N-acyltransferase family protein [Acutalibacter]|jgi:predicted choloylglycine hydrolase|uniref:carcinine hydrolase/isopenicillin-N N-acyltransferase family protein n=1 Tax=Acutalibacter TaxID=1918385 RepID=UPI0026F3AC7A|nr:MULTISPECIES: C45 family peptidase [Acutalibacter]